MNRVYTFDLPVDDMKRAKKFYEEVFGWKFSPVAGSGGNYQSAITVASDEKENPRFLEESTEDFTKEEHMA